MNWQAQAVILTAELIAGFVFGRMLIPYFRKIKTGKLELYIGDRFLKDGSEPKFGGVVVMLTVALGLCIGSFYESSASVSDLSGGYDIRFVLCGGFVCLLLLGIGIHEDYVKEKKLSIGIKSLYKYIMEFTVCICFLIMLKAFGFGSEQVMLPFRLGYINFGVLYYPLMAIFMTIGINLVKLHDCPAGVTDYSCDGLCAWSGLIFSIAIASSSAFSGNMDTAGLFAVCTTGALSAYLFWGISPSKLYLGESGGLLLGGLLSVMVIYSGLHILFLLMGLGIVVDGICAGLQRIVFKKSRKLLFKGNTLHEHFQKKGYGDYKIMAIFTLMSGIGCAGGIAFVIYSGKFL
ncbi:MAG: hypothetical protein ACI4I6_09210 [Hominimerdicola sp.]